MTTRVGISGWRYTPWRGVFYPRGMQQKLELWYASRMVTAIEINGSFYSLQRPAFFEQWHRETPDDFMFAIKGPRFITHMKRLRGVVTPLANFLASGIFALRDKLGPILWQFPANFHYDHDRFARFVESLPHDLVRAQNLARRRDFRVKGRAMLTIDENRRMRHAFEIRHESFLDPRFIQLLRDHGIALVVADTAGRFPLALETTTDFVYIRLHGESELYKSGYGRKSLDRWARRIEAWQSGKQPEDATRIGKRPAIKTKSRDVFCFFDNTDAKLRAPMDARSLLSRLQLGPSTVPDWRAAAPVKARCKATSHASVSNETASS